MGKIKKKLCKCLRCGYEWLTEIMKGEPKSCPACKSYRWNKPPKGVKNKNV